MTIKKMNVHAELERQIANMQYIEQILHRIGVPIVAEHLNQTINKAGWELARLREEAFPKGKP